jgi:DNA-binding NarL/FixJ family response regulator
MIRIAIADDQALVRTGFRHILNAEDGLEVVGEAPDGEHAVALAQKVVPDVCLMDVRMPGMDGIAATRRLMALPAPPRVVMLTTFDLDEYVLDALRAGASGFLLKDVSAADLGAAVRIVAGGDALLSPRVTRRLLERAPAWRAEAYAPDGHPGAPPARWARSASTSPDTSGWLIAAIRPSSSVKPSTSSCITPKSIPSSPKAGS